MHHIIEKTVGIGAVAVIAALLIMITGCGFPHRSSVEDVRITAGAQFILGSTLLQTAPVSRTPHQQAARYRELQSVTGMETSEALALLADIRNDPATAKKLYDTIQFVLTPRSDTAVHHK